MRLKELNNFNQRLCAGQHNLVVALKKKMNIQNIWLGGSGNDSQELCNSLTIAWLTGLMMKGGLGEDLKQQGFTYIR